jgi:hypothetical protein
VNGIVSFIVRFASVGLGTAALICGLIAAWYWYTASKIKFDPRFHELSDDVTETDFNWALVRAIMMAVHETSALNRVAALWTAAAVVLGGSANLVETLIKH